MKQYYMYKNIQELSKRDCNEHSVDIDLHKIIKDCKCKFLTIFNGSIETWFECYIL